MVSVPLPVKTSVPACTLVRYLFAGTQPRATRSSRKLLMFRSTEVRLLVATNENTFQPMLPRWRFQVMPSMVTVAATSPIGPAPPER